MTVRRQEGNVRPRALAVIGGLLALIAPTVAMTARLSAATTERVVADRMTGLALGGVDPVAYFTEKRMVMGRAEFEASQSGVVWRFQNADNRRFFLARPDIYAPQFGGYDPVDIARGVAYAGNPQHWLVAADRLYLFGSADSRAGFAADPAAIVREAEQSWPELRRTLAR
jgi:hypothetical protein